MPLTKYEYLCGGDLVGRGESAEYIRSVCVFFHAHCLTRKRFILKTNAKATDYNIRYGAIRWQHLQISPLCILLSSCPRYRHFGSPWSLGQSHEEQQLQWRYSMANSRIYSFALVLTVAEKCTFPILLSFRSRPSLLSCPQTAEDVSVTSLMQRSVA